MFVRLSVNTSLNFEPVRNKNYTLKGYVWKQIRLRTNEDSVQLEIVVVGLYFR